MRSYTLMIDFGLVVLIWMTQLIVYPGFTYYEPDDLIRWHQEYTPAITVIVGPLMVAQLVTHLFQVYRKVTVAQIIVILLILITWVHTSAFAVPLHETLTLTDDPIMVAKDLVEVNWFRTATWTLIFVLSVIKNPSQNEPKDILKS